eukprot:1576127-Pleurochrysis_carterae.AAC.1
MAAAFVAKHLQRHTTFRPLHFRRWYGMFCVAITTGQLLQGRERAQRPATSQLLWVQRKSGGWRDC